MQLMFVDGLVASEDWEVQVMTYEEYINALTTTVLTDPGAVSKEVSDTWVLLCHADLVIGGVDFTNDFW